MNPWTEAEAPLRHHVVSMDDVRALLAAEGLPREPPPGCRHGCLDSSCRHLITVNPWAREEPLVYNQVLASKLSSAALRCTQIADGEELMGYPESAGAYRAMASECKTLNQWVMSYARERMAA